MNTYYAVLYWQKMALRFSWVDSMVVMGLKMPDIIGDSSSN